MALGAKPGTAVTLVAGCDYRAADGQALSWSDVAWPNLTGATAITFSVAGTATGTGSIVTAGSGSQTVQVELTAAQTAALGDGLQSWYQLRATLASGHVVALVSYGRLQTVSNLA